MAALSATSLLVTALLLFMICDSLQECKDYTFQDGSDCNDLLTQYGPPMCDVNFDVCCVTCTEIRDSPPDDLSGPLVAEGYFVVDRKALDLYMREEGNNEAKARASLLKDANFYINDANVYYSTLQDYGLDIELRIVAIQLLDDDVVKKADVYGDNEVWEEDILHRFDEFLRKDSRARSTDDYDFAILFTGYDLEDPTAGYADSKAMCTDYACGVVEFTGLMDSANTLAHEVGHIFGAEHDKQGNYVMAATANHERDPNKFRFSKKSADSFKEYLGVKGTSSCLRETKSSSKIADFSVEKYNGQMQDPTSTCSRYNGEGSTICLGNIFYEDAPPVGDNVCYNIGCHSTKPGDNRCSYVYTPEGMACGKAKSCRRGECHEDSRAALAEVDSECPFGDEVNIYGNGETCESEIARRGSSLVCTENISSCCVTCRKYKTDIPGCEWGDGSFSGGMTCEKLDIKQKGRMCKVKHNAKVCCKYCHDKTAAISG